ncbi:STAS domain-containing protein [Micromonospora globbae]|uniref:STAS domain-containing protein n=1 Tax=Micromonospora globbae TaxID=1894969 RepID=UPI0034200E02|nr:STAS domain-containing protein [Micromonospora globbae]
MSDGTAVVTLFGELDIAAANPLGHVLLGAIARAPRVQVDFVNAHGRASGRGVSLALVNPTGHVRRVVSMTGILPLLSTPDAVVLGSVSKSGAACR